MLSGGETIVDDCSVDWCVTETLVLLSVGVKFCTVVNAFVGLDDAVTFALLLWECEIPTMMFPFGRSSCDLRIADSSSSIDVFTATVALF